MLNTYFTGYDPTLHIKTYFHQNFYFKKFQYNMRNEKTHKLNY